MKVFAPSTALALHKVGRIMASFKFLEKVYEHKVGEMRGCLRAQFYVFSRRSDPAWVNTRSES
jgi:hypothetical protein